MRMRMELKTKIMNQTGNEIVIKCQFKNKNGYVNKIKLSILAWRIWATIDLDHGGASTN